jgi:hypothetical protein
MHESFAYGAIMVERSDIVSRQISPKYKEIIPHSEQVGHDWTDDSQYSFPVITNRLPVILFNCSRKEIECSALCCYLSGALVAGLIRDRQGTSIFSSSTQPGFPQGDSRDFTSTDPE